jgi:phage terminase small subunit
MDAPRARSLLSHQWEGYAQYHQSRSNLVIHIVAVPIFLSANVLSLVALLRGQWIAAGAALVTMGASLTAQGRGHRREPKPPEPFTGPLNAMLRIFAEQWLTFPRFVSTGGWWRALRQRLAAERQSPRTWRQP